MNFNWECKNCKLSSGYPMIIEPCGHGTCSTCLACECQKFKESRISERSIRPNYPLGHQLEKTYVPSYMSFEPKTDPYVSKKFICWLIFISAAMAFLFYMALHYYMVYPLQVRSDAIHAVTCQIVDCQQYTGNMANITYSYQHITKNTFAEFNCSFHATECYYDCLENLTLKLSDLLVCYISLDVLNLMIIIGSVVVFILTLCLSIIVVNCT